MNQTGKILRQIIYKIYKMNQTGKILTRGIISTAANTVVATELGRFFKFGLDPLSIEAIGEGNGSNQYSLFGLPVWDVIDLRYEPENITATLSICQLEVNQSKNIITTAIQGLDGTIKEWIAAGDYQIKIKATIVGPAIDYYPGADITNIKALLDVKSAINIYSTILNKYMNINTIVITDYAISQPQSGMRNVQTVEISAISDDLSVYDVIK